jgi:hypothetical protein
MAVAFHLLTHRNLVQIEQLLRSIWHEDNTYVLHHDRRRPRAEHATLGALADRFPNVIIQRPTAVLWGRFSLYAAQHEGLRLALASGRAWTHWVNLSGQCQPLHRPTVIQQTLADSGDVSFVRNFRPLLEGNWPGPASRLTHRHLDSPALEWWLRLPGLGRRLRRWFGGEYALPSIPGIRLSLPTTFTWYGADNWVILSRQAGDYLIRSAEAAKIILALRHSGFPEESIFQSVIMNSPLAGQVRNDHLRCINWIPGVASPGIFRAADFSRLQTSAQEGRLFARKFDLDQDRDIIDRIDRELLGV